MALWILIRALLVWAIGLIVLYFLFILVVGGAALGYGYLMSLPIQTVKYIHYGLAFFVLGLSFWGVRNYLKHYKDFEDARKHFK